MSATKSRASSMMRSIATRYAESRNQTVGEFREWLLDDETTEEQISRAGKRGCTGEIAAAVAKLSSNLDLITIGAKVRVVTKARTTHRSARDASRRACNPTIRATIPTRSPPRSTRASPTGPATR